MHPGRDPRRARRWSSTLWGGVRKSIALATGAVLLLQGAVAAAPLSPKAPSAGGMTKQVVTSRHAAQKDQNPAAKIDKAVSQSFANNGRVTYLVKLRDSADVKAAAEFARKSAAPASREVTARSAVIRALQQTAESSQRSLVAELTREQQKGAVTRFESFWVNNMVLVTSSREVMERIAHRTEVERILANEEIFLIKQAPGPTKERAQEILKQKEKSTAAAGAPGPLSIEWGVQRVGAPIVWEQYGIDGTGIVVASMDTGVAGGHPALQHKYRGLGTDGSLTHTYSWYDAVNNQSAPYDDHGHGTHTVGTMLGSEPDGSNQIGVAPGARWIGAKILSASGNGSAENILRAGQWVLAPGGDPSKAPDVVNNSWGGGPGINEWFRDVVTAWRAAGIFPVFAAGNSGPGNGSVSTPGNYPESFAVGATDVNDNLAGFSGRGPSPYGEIKPEVSAPGVNVRSAVPGGGYEGGWNGTSMAAPHVAGVVALMKQADASLTVDEIELLLMESADPMTNSTYPSVPNNGYGHGIVNAFNAVGMVIDGVGSVSGRVLASGDDLEPPTVSHMPVTESFRHVPIRIEATVADNVSVTSVMLRFRVPGMSWWGVVDMERASGNHTSGVYQATIPAEMTAGDQVEYYIQALDFGGNSGYSGTQRNPHRVTLMAGLTPGYIQDFEGSAPGWVSDGTNNPWQIGVPTSGPGGARSGTRVAATNLSGNYPDGADAWLMMPPIDLSGGPAALRFHQWYDFESNFDYGFVIATGDGGANWDMLAAYTGANTSWHEVTLDLSAYAGNPSVYVAFYLYSDGSVVKPGWYLDDVELFVGNEPPAPPQDLIGESTAVGSVALSWFSSAGDVTHFTVYRSMTSGSGYTSLGNTTGLNFVDTNTTAGQTYYYTVTATNMFGLESAMSNEVAVTVSNVSVIFSDDMESGEGAWTHSGGLWQWGAPTSGPNGAHSGTKVWATNLSDTYPNNANASLVTPPLNLSGLSAASLQFAHWFSIERNYDFGRVEVTTDGGSNWTTLAQYTAPGSGGQPVGWENPLLDLTDYVGQTIQIRFRFTSDSSVVYPGWYIDDVMVAGTPVGGSRVRPVHKPGSAIKPELIQASGKPKGIDPSQMQLKLDLNAKAQGSQATKVQTSAVKASGIGTMALPLNATVTVVETDRVVRTSPADGSYSLTLPAGSYTLRAAAYGYFSQDKSVTVSDGSDSTANFLLQPVPRGQISGVVTDERTGAPIEGATVTLREDPMVPAATTNASGQFTIEAMEGSYTVDIRARGYYPSTANATVTGGGTASLSVAMEPFIGMPGEIKYDDGSGENAWGFYGAGNGWAVRMSPEGANQTVVVTGVKVYLWDATWPTPGGNSFRAAIYAAAADGKPGALLAGPVRVTDGVRGAWNEVDFSGHGISVTGDFYVAYIQDQPYPNVPGMAFDESTPDTKRNWQLVEGNWAPWDVGGNAMIRAMVSVAVGAPTITTPADQTYTNQSEITVGGTSVVGTEVRIYMNEAMTATMNTGSDGTWSATVNMAEGEHVLTATATVPGGGTTNHSAPVHVIVDQTMPALALASPGDGSHQNSRILSISGQAVDAYLAGVTVNGTAATVNADGSFMVELIGQEGANTITVVARDRAGNETTEVRTVHVDSQGPAINNLQPASDTVLGPGSTLTVSFDSEPGLALAAFRIVVDTSASGAKAGAASMEPGEIRMTEVSPGRYVGQWTVPSGFTAPSAYVQVRAVDAAGNSSRATAAGKLRITDNRPPTAVISAPNSGRVNDRITFDGRSSNDPDGSIVSYLWEMGDGQTYSANRVVHRYQQAGTYTVRLTVTDNRGATGTTTHTIVINAR